MSLMTYRYVSCLPPYCIYLLFKRPPSYLRKLFFITGWISSKFGAYHYSLVYIDNQCMIFFQYLSIVVTMNLSLRILFILVWPRFYSNSNASYHYYIWLIQLQPEYLYPFVFTLHSNLLIHSKNVCRSIKSYRGSIGMILSCRIQFLINQQSYTTKYRNIDQF